MEPIDIAIAGEVATITLQRPAALNALDMETATRLLQVISHGTDAKVLVLTGSGRAFCAGGDVNAMARSGDAADYIRRLTDVLHPLILKLTQIPIPIVARVNGAVAGAGLGLVLVADVVVAEESATFSSAYGRLGVTPDCGVSALLPLAVGRSRATNFLMRARTIDARTAESWGLVHHVASDVDLDAQVREVAADLSVSGSDTLARLKTQLALAPQWLEEHLDREARDITLLAGTERVKSRIARFGVSNSRH